MSIKDIYRLSFSLYVIISLFSFMVYAALPAIMAKNNVPPQDIGLLFMAFLPFPLRFFYSGFIESYRKKILKTFRDAIVIALLGFLYFY